MTSHYTYSFASDPPLHGITFARFTPTGVHISTLHLCIAEKDAAVVWDLMIYDSLIHFVSIHVWIMNEAAVNTLV